MEGEAPRKRMGKVRCPGSPESKTQKERSSESVWERQEAPEAPEAKRRRREALETYGEGKVSRKQSAEREKLRKRMRNAGGLMGAAE